MVIRLLYRATSLECHQLLISVHIFTTYVRTISAWRTSATKEKVQRCLCMRVSYDQSQSGTLYVKAIQTRTAKCPERPPGGVRVAQHDNDNKRKRTE